MCCRFSSPVCKIFKGFLVLIVRTKFGFLLFTLPQLISKKRLCSKNGLKCHSIIKKYPKFPLILFTHISIFQSLSLKVHNLTFQIATGNHTSIISWSRWSNGTLNSLISMEFFLFFLREFSQLHALLEPPRLLIFEEFSQLHHY